MKTEKTLIGEAGEHIACADLLLKGVTASIVNGHVYDILIDRHGHFERVQVKTSRNRIGQWSFASGGARNRSYGDDVDSYAYVFLTDSAPVVRYWKKPPTTVFKSIPDA